MSQPMLMQRLRRASRCHQPGMVLIGALVLLSLGIDRAADRSALDRRTPARE